MFPTFMFHSQLAPEGKCFPTPADEPTDGFAATGWVDTPAAFEPGYVKPEPINPEGSVPADAPPGFIPQLFPSWRYNRAGAAKQVASQDEANALDPAEWKDTNDPDAWDEAKWAAKQPSKAAAAKLNMTIGDATTAPPPTTPPPAPVRPATDEEMANATREQEKLELYALSVPNVARAINGNTNVETLNKMRLYEAENPKGTRKGVLEAIDAQLAALVP